MSNAAARFREALGADVSIPVASLADASWLYVARQKQIRVEAAERAVVSAAIEERKADLEFDENPGDKDAWARVVATTLAHDAAVDALLSLREGTE